MTTQENIEAFHTKYRPLSLKRIIGHEDAVTRLQGMIKSKKIPNALLITGPTSAGKTTLARAFSCAVNGVNNIQELGGAFQEINAADQRGIDDVRNLIRTSKFRSQFNRRIILLDEAHQLVSNNAAVQTLLKPLEEPTPGTLWILCSMDPQKFTSGVGRAIANRCSQISLQPHTSSDLLKQAKRIMKGESMDYAETVLKTVVKQCNGEMRTLANLMQALANYVDGLDKTPKALKSKDVATALSSAVPQDDRLAVEVLSAVYCGQYKTVVKSILDVQDGFRFVTTLLWGASHMLYTTALGGAKHPEIKHWALVNKELERSINALPKEVKSKLTLGVYAQVNEALVNMKGELLVHASEPKEFMAARLYRLIKQIHS